VIRGSKELKALSSLFLGERHALGGSEKVDSCCDMADVDAAGVVVRGFLSTAAGTSATCHYAKSGSTGRSETLNMCRPRRVNRRERVLVTRSLTGNPVSGTTVL
jgi:hypothetical protein